MSGLLRRASAAAGGTWLRRRRGEPPSHSALIAAVASASGGARGGPHRKYSETTRRRARGASAAIRSRYGGGGTKSSHHAGRGSLSWSSRGGEGGASAPFSSQADCSERESMEYDVVIVGAGPAGLSAAIRLKQLDAELSVCVVEKGAEVGAHILSGNVFEPRALDELLPDWREQRDAAAAAGGEDAAATHPVRTRVTEDRFSVLTSSTGEVGLPGMLLPKELHNDGNYIVSLSQLCRWLGEQAEEMGVEIYPGFAAAEVLYSYSDSDTSGSSGKRKEGVLGIATRDVGIAKSGEKKATFERGVELRGRQTLFAEGARGSCSEEVMGVFDLRKECDVQLYGLGIKEVWQVPDSVSRPGYVQHTLGWPLQSHPLDRNFGGSFLYHMDGGLVQVGFVVGLGYENPYLNPYQEFQQWKHHPSISAHLKGGECISYGARVLNEGGYHALPKVTFPGGALLGCAAGTLNSVKIKGTHTAVKSGMLAAEATHHLLTVAEGEGEPSGATDAPKESDFQERLDTSWVVDELKSVRNCHASFKAGVVPGLLYTALSTFLLKGREPWSIRVKTSDAESTKKATECSPIDYPKPDGKLSFDLLSNLARSGTNHEHDQPAHLRIKPSLQDVPEQESLQVYAGPEQRFCPAAVYEYAASASEEEGEGGGGGGEGDDKKHQQREEQTQRLVINAQNCVHCKCCSIKMPREYIDWTVPEGGGGPSYTLT